jgi:hypothetical protein
VAQNHSYLVSLLLFIYLFVEEIKIYFVFNNSPPTPEGSAVCEIMWQNAAQTDRQTDRQTGHSRRHIIIRRMRFACCLTRARIQTHFAEYFILSAFPLKQWLRERSSVLRYGTLSALLLFCLATQRGRFRSPLLLDVVTFPELVCW